MPGSLCQGQQDPPGWEQRSGHAPGHPSGVKSPWGPVERTTSTAGQARVLTRLPLRLWMLCSVSLSGQRLLLLFVPMNLAWV
jgi:hypothetical protein